MRSRLRSNASRSRISAGVRSDPDLPALERSVHAIQIALERVEVEDQRRRIYFRQRHADFGGTIDTHVGMRTEG